MSGAITRSAAAEAGVSRTYQLAIRIAAPVRIAVGRLGVFDFPAGDYVYTGSAKRNLEARIARHLATQKKFHWHIDYLLAAPGVSIREVRRFAAPECEINARQVGEILVPGFGASDCRAGCGSHLKRRKAARREEAAAVIKPNYWNKAARALARADPVLAAIIRAHPDGALVSRGDPFGTLARSIVGQQISVKAADSVWARFAAAVPAMTPAAVRALGPEALRACGLSARKAEYLADLARHFSDGSICAKRWDEAADADIIAELTAVRGIGVWTAEMFLIFNQMRPDVFPLDDIGLQKAAARHYFDGERPSRQQLIALGERWRPWRSVATWYLWRSLDPLPVEY